MGCAPSSRTGAEQGNVDDESLNEKEPPPIPVHIGSGVSKSHEHSHSVIFLFGKCTALVPLVKSSFIFIQPHLPIASTCPHRLPKHPLPQKDYSLVDG